jgi:DNA-binding transcriptional regulator YiaG
MEIERDDLLRKLREQPRHERIVTLRALYKLSQAGLANVAGVLRGTVSTWEAPTHDTQGGRGHEPSKMARTRMATYFDLPAYVFTDEWGKGSVSAGKGRGGPPTKSGAPKREPVIRVPAPGKVKDDTPPPPNVKRLG